MNDLVTLAHDVAAEAEMVVLAVDNPHVGRFTYEAYVQHADMLWTGCMHGHRTTRAAVGCMVPLATGWTEGRAATIVEVSPGVIEWQWITGKSKGGTPLGEFRRCRPEPVGDAVVEDFGLVTSFARTA